MNEVSISVQGVSVANWWSHVIFFIIRVFVHLFVLSTLIILLWAKSRLTNCLASVLHWNDFKVLCFELHELLVLFCKVLRSSFLSQIVIVASWCISNILLLVWVTLQEVQVFVFFITVFWSKIWSYKAPFQVTSLLINQLFLNESMMVVIVCRSKADSQDKW